jgi:hypothetical protein
MCRTDGDFRGDRIRFLRTVEEKAQKRNPRDMGMSRVPLLPRNI